MLYSIFILSLSLITSISALNFILNWYCFYKKILFTIEKITYKIIIIGNANTVKYTINNKEVIKKRYLTLLSAHLNVLNFKENKGISVTKNKDITIDKIMSI